MKDFSDRMMAIAAVILGASVLLLLILLCVIVLSAITGWPVIHRIPR